MNNTLRYLRPARKYIEMQFDVKQADLEMLLFLEGIGKFTKQDLKRFELMMSWNTQRLNHLIDGGWVVKFRNALHGRQKALYVITKKGKNILNQFYKMLETGVFPDSSRSKHNRASATQAEKKYARVYGYENAMRKVEAQKKGKL